MLQVGQIVLGVYGVLLIAGGVLGKVKAGSTVSLAAGGICGVVCLYCLWLSTSDPAVGLLIGGFVAMLLTGISINRFAATRKAMPAGILLVLSLAAGIALIVIQQRLSLPTQG